MPRKNGYETVLEIRKLYPGIKVLVLTMFNNEFAVLKMLRSGAHGYLLKNCHPNDLKIAMLAIINDGYYHSEFITNRVIKSMEKGPDEFPKISEKETLFLTLCCRDINYKQMADELNCSPRTVEGYRDSLFNKLNLRTRTALAMYAIQIGLVPF